MKKDAGWEFLFSKNQEPGSYCDEDGNEWYIYSDGSGNFNGADGSTGYKYSDGSGNYNGADGSTGYKYSDGSGNYQGADGVDAYQYSDGSGYYVDANGYREDYYPEITDDNSKKSNSSSTGEFVCGTIAGAIIGIGTLAMKYNEQERIAKEKKQHKRQMFRKKHKKEIITGVFVGISILISFLALIIAVVIHNKLTVVNYNPEDFVNQKYDVVVELLKNEGFTEFELRPLNDLALSEEDRADLVERVIIDGEEDYTSNSEYFNDDLIIIEYHSIRLISPPISSGDAEGENYVDIIKIFSEAGFTNIRVEIEYDIITGWITDDGEVESVVINGEKKFNTSSEFRPDSEIIITYHTFKNKAPK